MKVHWKRWMYVFVLVFVLGQTSVVQAATELTYEVSSPKEFVTGSEVEITISIKNNPGLTTTGLRLVYDNTVLKYKGENWTEELKSGGSSLVLVSDVDYGQKKALNISFVDTVGYAKEGKLITLRFEVLKDFSGSPTELVFRDAADKNEKSLFGEILGNETTLEQTPEVILPDKEESGAYDDTFKTGAVSVETILILVCLGMTIMGIICTIWIKRLKRDERREVQNIMGFRADKEHIR